MSDLTNDGRIVGRLLLAAAFLDMILVITAAQLAAPRLASHLKLSEEESLFFGFLGFLVLAWGVSDIVLGGRSLGRTTLGLSARTKDNMPVPPVAFAKRFLLKLGTLGLSGLRLDAPAPYDARIGIVWLSDLGAVAASSINARPKRGSRSRTPIASWSLRVMSGPDAGKRRTLGRLAGFAENRAVKIGRDQSWADFALPRSSRVSSRHCVLRFRGEVAELMDYGTEGRGSQNGTLLNGRPLPALTWVEIGDATHFKLADVTIAIGR